MCPRFSPEILQAGAVNGLNNKHTGVAAAIVHEQCSQRCMLFKYCPYRALTEG